MQEARNPHVNPKGDDDLSSQADLHLKSMQPKRADKPEHASVFS